MVNGKHTLCYYGSAWTLQELQLFTVLQVIEAVSVFWAFLLYASSVCVRECVCLSRPAGVFLHVCVCVWGLLAAQRHPQWNREQREKLLMSSATAGTQTRPANGPCMSVWWWWCGWCWHTLQQSAEPAVDCGAATGARQVTANTAVMTKSNKQLTCHCSAAAAAYGDPVQGVAHFHVISAPEQLNSILWVSCFLCPGGVQGGKHFWLSSFSEKPLLLPKTLLASLMLGFLVSGGRDLGLAWCLCERCFHKCSSSPLF